MTAWASSVSADDRVELDDLGYADGLTLEGQGARETVFFPIPPGAEGARLSLDAGFSQALDHQSSLTVRVAGEPLATLVKRDGDRQTSVYEVPARLLDDAFLPVELAGDLAIGRSPCVDNNRPSVWARLAPASGVTYMGRDQAETLGDLWRTLAEPVRIAMLPAPSASEVAAALIIMADLKRRGLDAVPTVMGASVPAELPDIVIGDAPWPEARALAGGNDAALSVLAVDGRPGGKRAIWVQTPPAARLLAARDELVRGQTYLADVAQKIAPGERRGGAGDQADHDRRLPFSELGAPTRSITFTTRGDLRVDIPMAQVPSGYIPRAAAVSLRGPALGENDALLVNAYTNGTYADSIRLDAEVVLNAAPIAFARERLGGTNTLALDLQRLAPERPCSRNITTTVQLHGDSYVALEPGGFTPARLRDWTARYDETVEVVLPQGLNDRLRTLPLVARLLAEGSQPVTDIRVTERPSGDGPFIHVAPTPPQAYDSSPIVTDKGRVRIETTDGQVLEFDPGGDLTLVQLVERGDDWGIWVAPGARTQLPARRGLGDGDAALIPPSGTPVRLNTRADAFAVTYPERKDALTLLDRYRDAVFWGFWIVLSLVVAVVVIRMRRKQESS